MEFKSKADFTSRVFTINDLLDFCTLTVNSSTCLPCFYNIQQLLFYMFPPSQTLSNLMSSISILNHENSPLYIPNNYVSLLINMHSIGSLNFYRCLISLKLLRYLHFNSLQKTLTLILNTTAELAVLHIKSIFQVLRTVGDCDILCLLWVLC